MAIKWLKHGKWPRWMIRIHYYSIISFTLLMLSGIALFLPSVHTVLIPYLKMIYYIHIVLGLIFGVTLLTPVFARLPVGKLLRKLDWMFPVILGSVIVWTGILIWRVAFFPASWRSVAFQWHSWVSYVLTGWFVIHATYKALGYTPSKDGLNPRINLERRRFIVWLGGGVLTTGFVTMLDPGRIFRNLFQKSPSGPLNSGTSEFAAFYTVTGGYPAISLESYRLTVGGLVSHPIIFHWNDLLNLPQVTQKSDFDCVTGWTAANVRWKGFHIGDLLKVVNPVPNAKYIHFYSADGVYTESLSITEALDSTVLLAHQLNGEPLDMKQGYPLRLVVPKMYGYKSIKWVDRIALSDKPLTGYWELRGYPDEAYVGGSI